MQPTGYGGLNRSSEIVSVKADSFVQIARGGFQADYWLAYT